MSEKNFWKIGCIVQAFIAFYSERFFWKASKFLNIKHEPWEWTYDLLIYVRSSNPHNFWTACLIFKLKNSLQTSKPVWQYCHCIAALSGAFMKKKKSYILVSYVVSTLFLSRQTYLGIWHNWSWWVERYPFIHKLTLINIYLWFVKVLQFLTLKGQILRPLVLWNNITFQSVVLSSIFKRLKWSQFSAESIYFTREHI